jgi:hypothetical protein
VVKSIGHSCGLQRRLLRILLKFQVAAARDLLFLPDALEPFARLRSLSRVDVSRNNPGQQTIHCRREFFETSIQAIAPPGFAP